MNALRKDEDDLQKFTIKDIFVMPEGERAELVDGELYMMTPPTYIHQNLLTNISTHINNYIDAHQGSCEVLVAPFAVYLSDNNRNYLEPDILVVCDKDKLQEDGCHGAPDWIIEIASPSSIDYDKGVKLFKYRNSGIKEYWLVNPMEEETYVYQFGKKPECTTYSFDTPVPSGLYADFSLSVRDIL